METKLIIFFWLILFIFERSNQTQREIIKQVAKNSKFVRKHIDQLKFKWIITSHFKGKKLEYYFKMNKSDTDTKRSKIEHSESNSYFQEVWAFQIPSEGPAVVNPDRIESHIIPKTQNTSEIAISRFGALSIRIPQKFNTFKYTIDSKSECQDMQMFFSTSELPGDLTFGEGYSRIGLGGVANDFDKYFWPDLLPSARDLKDQMALFYKRHGLSDDDPIFLNLFCPFWKKSGASPDLRITFNYDNVRVEKLDLYQRSRREFERVTAGSATSAVKLFESYFDKTVRPPDVRELSQREHSDSKILKVARVYKRGILIEG